MTTNSTEIISDILGAIERLMESLVISYQLDKAAGTFTLVADHSEPARPGQRSFVALRFFGVRGFHRVPGNLIDLQEFAEVYSITDLQRPFVIQSVNTTDGEHDRRMEISLGSNFGEIAFHYDSVKAIIRHACAEQQDDTWLYRDARSGKTFDFARPFEGLLDML